MDTSKTHRDELIERLFATMEKTKRGMHAHMHAINRMVPIPRAQLELLTVIRYGQPISSRELARQLYMTPGAVSQLVDGLAEQELIVRRIDAKDRRVQCLEVSKKGDAVLESVEKQRREIMQSVVQELTDQELEVWVTVQQKLIERFQAKFNKETK